MRRRRLWVHFVDHRREGAEFTIAAPVPGPSAAVVAERLLGEHVETAGPHESAAVIGQILEAVQQAQAGQQPPAGLRVVERCVVFELAGESGDTVMIPLERVERLVLTKEWTE